MKIITKTITKYIANDNTEWNSEEDCRNYENVWRVTNKLTDKLENIRTPTKKLIDKLEIEELRNVKPPLYDVYEYADFRWYDIKNPDDYKLISEYYRKQHDVVIEVDSLPAIICVEKSDDDVWVHTLNEILNRIDTFNDTMKVYMHK